MPNLNVTLTQDIYIKSRPPEVQALIAMSDPSLRAAQADVLAAQGITLCKEIDIWGGAADKWMFTWAQMGLTFWPSYGQPPLILAGGLEQQITLIDVAHPWPGSIKVSVDADDYPPHDPATAPAKLPMVGALIGNGIYAANLAAVTSGSTWLLKDGQVVTQDGKQYVYHFTQTPFGPSDYFTVVAA